MRGPVFLLVAVVVAMGTVDAAFAAVGWRHEQTVRYSSGLAEPDVAVAADGRAALVFMSARYNAEPSLDLWVRRADGPEPFIPGAATPPGGATDARIAMSPDGVTAVAALDSGRLFVTMYPASPRDRYRGKVVAIDAPGVADQPEVAIDAAGRATVVWASPPRVNAYGFDLPRQAYAVTVGPDAAVGPVQALGEPGDCDPALDVNLRGDASVAVSCGGRPGRVFHRPAGGTFDVGQSPFPEAGTVQVGVDGTGAVHALQTTRVETYEGRQLTYDTRLSYSVRPAGGAFSPPEAIERSDGGTVGDVDFEVQETGRVIAGWVAGERFAYAVRESGGRFGAARTVARARRAARDADAGPAADVVASPSGPVLVAWKARSARRGGREHVSAALLRSDGALADRFSGIPGAYGAFTAGPAFAINDHGQAAGAWEQRCRLPDGAFAVTAVQRDAGGTPNAPPCQDRRPPRVALEPRRAVVKGRRLRVRFLCGEACLFSARVRVRSRGAGRPIAVARTSGKRWAANSRWRWLDLRLSRAEARRIVRTRRAGRRMKARLSLSVRDRYGSRRVARRVLRVRSAVAGPPADGRRS